MTLFHSSRSNTSYGQWLVLCSVGAALAASLPACGADTTTSESSSGAGSAGASAGGNNSGGSKAGSSSGGSTGGKAGTSGGGAAGNTSAGASGAGTGAGASGASGAGASSGAAGAAGTNAGAGAAGTSGGNDAGGASGSGGGATAGSSGSTAGAGAAGTAGAAGANGGAAGSSAVTCIEGLSALAITGPSSPIKLTGGAASPVTISATGTISGSAGQNVAGSALSWSVSRDDHTDPGSIDGGVFTPNPSAGGTVTITATDGCVSASTTVQLFLDATVGDGSNPAWQAPPVTGGTAPTIVYPSDDTRFPRNIYRTLFQWTSKGGGPFRLTFQGASSKVVVYTDGVHPTCATAAATGGSCWEADEATWAFIAASNAGGTVTWTVDRLDTTVTPAVVRSGTPITIGFSKQDVPGAIFYWSTSSAGVRRARLSEPAPEDYLVGKPGTTYTDPVEKVKCVACHTVSRDGKYLAAPVSANDSGLWVTEVTKTAPPKLGLTPVPGTSGNGFATFSPDDAHVVASFNKKLFMVNRETGEKQQDLPLGTLGATHPDWSPTGKELVFSTKAGDAPSDAALGIFPWDGQAFGTPQVLLTPPKGTTYLFPNFSPDGELIAFSKGKGGHGDKTTQLALVSRAGGALVECKRANTIVSNKTTTGQFENNQPTWAPEGDYYWLAFNSMREYGVVLPEGTQQIWVAAIDKSKIGTGVDPSFPAFRLQFQGLAENNHRAYWTLDVAAGGAGGSGGAAGSSGAGGAGGTSGGAGGAAGAGGAPVCKVLGADCDPVDDCCVEGSLCDSYDDGVTYTCKATKN